jgi:hypothetical protein
MLSAVWLLSWLAAFSLFGQVQKQPSPAPMDMPSRELKATGHIKTNVPMFGGKGNARCDASGNVFYNAGEVIFDHEHYVEHGPYLEVSADGQSHVIFTVPPEVTNTDSIWAVTPDGTLYTLSSDSDNSKLVHFANDGQVANISSLALPKRAKIQRMAVTNNGTVFVEGYLAVVQDDSKPVAGFAAIFDASGKMTHDLSVGRAEVDPIEGTKHIPEGDLIAGDDGKFYELEPREVRVFNQLGDQTSSLKLTKPSEDALALHIDESQGWISVIFDTLSKPKPGWASVLQPTAVVMDTQSEMSQRVYTFDPALTGSIDCYNAQNGYTLTAVDHRMLAWDQAAVQ